MALKITTTDPGAPGLTAMAGVAAVTLNWTAPTSTGGTAITGYELPPADRRRLRLRRLDRDRQQREPDELRGDRPHRRHRLHLPAPGAQCLGRGGVFRRSHGSIATADTTPPALESATVLADGTTIELVFDEPYDRVAAAVLIRPRYAPFIVTADGSSVTVGQWSYQRRSADGRHRTIQLNDLSPAITYGQTVIVSYIDPTTGDDAIGVLQDEAGNDVASFTTGSGGVPAVVNTVPQPANASPAFPSESTTREVAENSPAGTNVGDPVTATDDDNDTLTYTLEGTDAASFDIDSASGQIQTKAGVTYDYETTPSYAVVVKADDSNGGTDTVAVAINLLDVPEPPAITLAFDVAGLRSGVVERDEDAGTVAIGLRAQTEGNAPPLEDFEVILRTVDQTAKAPRDYVAATLTYAFGAADFVLENGQYVQTVSHDIEIVDDEIVEQVEYFELDLDRNALPGHVTAPSITTVVIEIQKDDRTTVSVESVTVDEGDEVVLTFTSDRAAGFLFLFLVTEIVFGDELIWTSPAR